MEAKKVIRKEIFKKRSEVTEEQVLADSHLIMEKLFQLPEFEKASCIYAYADYNHEVSTKELITRTWELGKKVAVPKVHGKDMIFTGWTPLNSWNQGIFRFRNQPEGKPWSGGML